MSEKFDFSKIEDQQKFEQLPQEDKKGIIYRAIEESQSDIQREKWQRQVDVWQKDPVIKKEIDELLKLIDFRQEKISSEILEKVQDIGEPHFAAHGTHDNLGLFFSLLQDGIFSENYAKYYHSKNLKGKRNITSNFGNTTEKQQGDGRVSTNSPAPMINTLEKILYDEAPTNIYPIAIRQSNKYSHELNEKIIEKLNELFQKAGRAINVERLDICNGINSAGQAIGYFETDKKFWLTKKYLIRDLAIFLYEQLTTDIGYIDEDIYPILNNFLKK